MSGIASERITLRKVPAGWERDAFIAWLAGPDVEFAGIVVDMTDCPSGVPTHVIVKRASGFVAAWSMTSVDQAADVARECNRLAPRDVAHVSAWDDSVWDAVLASDATGGQS